VRQGGREGVDSEIAMIGGLARCLCHAKFSFKISSTLNTFLILEGVPPRAYYRKGKKDPGLKSGESGARAP